MFTTIKTKLKNLSIRLFSAIKEKSSWVSIFAACTFIWGPDFFGEDKKEMIESLGMGLASVALYYIKSAGTKAKEDEKAKETK